MCSFYFSYVQMVSSSFPENIDIDKETKTEKSKDEFTVPDNRGKRKDVSGTSGASSQPSKAHKKSNTKSHV